MTTADKPARLLGVGKLQPELLARILSRAASDDPRVILGPGIGLDCAVVDLGDRVLLTKGVPVEATTLLAREFPERLRAALTGAEIAAARPSGAACP